MKHDWDRITAKDSSSLTSRLFQISEILSFHSVLKITRGLQIPFQGLHIVCARNARLDKMFAQSLSTKKTSKTCVNQVFGLQNVLFKFVSGWRQRFVSPGSACAVPTAPGIDAGRNLHPASETYEKTFEGTVRRHSHCSVRSCAKLLSKSDNTIRQQCAKLSSNLGLSGAS